MPKRLNILNSWVDDITKEECLKKIEKFVKSSYSRRVHTIFASNPEKIFSVPKHPLVYEEIKNADILLPDGIGVVLAVRFLYGIKISRLPGADMMEEICKLAAKKGYKVFIYGAKEEVNKKAVDILIKRYQGLNIVGRSHGYVKEKDMENLIEKINNSKAEILFVALGSPRQEKWIAEYKNRLNTVKVCQGIGGTLDTIAGNVKRAPVFWQKLNLEWFYRLLLEPKRIKRQKVLPVFLFLILKEKVRLVYASKK